MKKIFIVLITLLSLTIIGGCSSSSSSDDKKTDTPTTTQAITADESKLIFMDLLNISKEEMVKSIVPVASATAGKRVDVPAAQSYNNTVTGDGGGTITVKLVAKPGYEIKTATTTYNVTGDFTFAKYKAAKESMFTYNGVLGFVCNARLLNVSDASKMTGTITFELKTTNFTANTTPVNVDMKFTLAYPSGEVTYTGTVNGNTFSGKETIKLTMPTSKPSSTTTQALTATESKEAYTELFAFTSSEASNAVNKKQPALKRVAGTPFVYSQTIQGAVSGNVVVSLSVKYDYNQTTNNINYVLTGKFTFTNFKNSKDSNYTYNGVMDYSCTMDMTTSSAGETSAKMKYLLSTTNFTANGLPLNMNMNFTMTMPDFTYTYSGSVNGEPYTGSETLNFKF